VTLGPDTLRYFIQLFPEEFSGRIGAVLQPRMLQCFDSRLHFCRRMLISRVNVSALRNRSNSTRKFVSPKRTRRVALPRCIFIDAAVFVFECRYTSPFHYDKQSIFAPASNLHTPCQHPIRSICTRGNKPLLCGPKLIGLQASRTILRN